MFQTFIPNFGIKRESKSLHNFVESPELNIGDETLNRKPFIEKQNKWISGSWVKSFSVFLFFLIFFFCNSFLVSAREIDLATINNFNIRYDGPNGGALSNGAPIIIDLNNDGAPDLFIGAPSSRYFYIIYNSLLSSLSSKGNMIDLSNPSNYNIRYSSGSTGGLSNFKSTVADLNGDGKNDIIVGAPYKSNNSRFWSGSVFILYNDLFSTLSGTGNNIDITTSSNYSKRFDGAASEDNVGETIQVVDLDNDSKLDLVISAPQASKNSRNYSGSVYVIYNSLLTTLSSQNIDLNTTSNYNIRFDGVNTYMSLSLIGLLVKDLNNDNKADLLIGAYRANFNSRTDSGSLYVIYNSLISRFTTTGNNVDLNISTNYNLRFDGAVANDKFGNEAITVVDLNGNGSADLLVGSYNSSHNSQTSSGSLYIIHDSIISSFVNTGNNIDLAISTNYNLRYDGATGNKLGTGVSVADFDGDGKNDILAHATYSSFNSRSQSGSLYIINNSLFSTYTNAGNNIDLTSSSNYSLRFDGAQALGQFADVGGTVGDLNSDGKIDLIIGAPFTSYNGNSNNGSLYIIYNFPHSISLNSISSLIKDSSFTVSGTVAATQSVTNIKSVQYSLDNSAFTGVWSSCTATDGNFDSTSDSFNCDVSTSGLTDGSHTIRFRAYDDNISYTAISNYSSASFTYDHTSPKVDWTDTSGNSKKYESQGNDNVFTTDQLPTFTFSKSSDSTSGLTRYEIIVDGKTYITNIDPTKPGDKDYREDDDKYVRYDGDNNISVHAKKDSDKLVSGKAYKWKVRAVDSAGNSTDTVEKILRINTHEANFSGTWFPLTLLNIGDNNINFSSINSSQVSDLTINSLTPTFYGIAPVGTKVTLRIEKENDSKTGRDLVLTTTSSANESSRFGINITDKLEKQEYFINLSAVNPQGDYMELPEFKLNIGGTGILQKIDDIIKPKNVIPTPTKKGNSRLEGDDTGTSIGLKSDKTVKKHCFLWMCW